MKQANKTNLLVNTIEKEIKDGKLGKSGEEFLTVRELAKNYGVSPVTALRVIEELKQKNLISSLGKKTFITYGKIANKSALKERLDKLPSRANGLPLVGIHLPVIKNPFFSALAQEISSLLYKKGFLSIISSSDQDEKKEKEILTSFLSLGAVGVISCPNANQASLPYYNGYPLPTVYLASRLFQDEELFVMVNHEVAAKQVAEHLIEMGYEHFMYVGESNNATDLRGKFFIETLKSLGKNIPDENIITLSTSNQFAPSAPLVNAIKNAKKPLGIFCYHDLIAAGAILSCNKLALKIPEDVGVVGFDDLSIAKQCRPALSTISYRFDKMAETAVNLLLNKINASGSFINSQLDYVNHYLTVRESSKRKTI